jgi:hypothetical protein
MNEEKTYPLAKWTTITILVVFALIPLINMIVNGYNNLYINFSGGLALDKLGQLGDFFGGHTAAFAGLFSTTLILYFSSKQLSMQQSQFREQAKLSKQTADLTSINNIYQHYGEMYGADRDAADILKSIANGHRRWAIRESFSIIDPDEALENHRATQVSKDYEALLNLLKMEHISEIDIRSISFLTSSLLLDRRLIKEERTRLWELYEILRASPLALITEDSDIRKSFEVARRKFYIQVQP